MSMVAPRVARGGRWVVAPDSAQAVAQRIAVRRARRRRQVLLVLFLCGAVASAVLAVLRGGPFVGVNLASDGLLVIYVAYLIDSTRRRIHKEALLRPAYRERMRDAHLFGPLHASGGRR